MPSRGYLNFEYKPISLEEWLAPAMMATQYQRDLEDKYLQLQSEVNAWDKIKANEQDSKLYDSIYKPYLDAINAGADELTAKGSNPNSRRKLYALTAQYNQVIKPIEEAYNKREADQARWQDAYYKNPNLIIEKEPESYSLQDYIDGNYSSPKIIDKDQVYKNALTSFQPLAKALRSDPQWERMHGYWAIKSQEGYSPEEIMIAITDPDKADPMLRAAVESVIDSSNAMSWSNPAQAISAITPVVNQALTYAMGKANIEYKNDLDYQMNLELRKMNYKAGIDRENLLYQSRLKGGDNKGGDEGVTGRYPTADVGYPGRNQSYNKDWDVDNVKYQNGQWIKDGRIVGKKDTKDLYNNYKESYSYLTPESAIAFGSSLDKAMSLRVDNGAQYTTNDASYGISVGNLLKNLYADEHVNFYDRNGKSVNPNDWQEKITEAEKNNYKDVLLVMDGDGFHMKVGKDWYDSMLPNGTSTAKNEIKKADYYVNNVYKNLSDFSDGGIVLEGNDNLLNHLYDIATNDAKSLDGSPSLRHIRYRIDGDDTTIYNFVIDLNTGRYYTSSSTDILMGGDDFSDTMYDVYQTTLYDVMKSFSGPSSK